MDNNSIVCTVKTKGGRRQQIDPVTKKFTTGKSEEEKKTEEERKEAYRLMGIEYNGK